MEKCWGIVILFLAYGGHFLGPFLVAVGNTTVPLFDLTYLAICDLAQNEKMC